MYKTLQDYLYYKSTRPVIQCISFTVRSALNEAQMTSFTVSLSMSLIIVIPPCSPRITPISNPMSVFSRCQQEDLYYLHALIKLLSSVIVNFSLSKQNIPCRRDTVVNIADFSFYSPRQGKFANQLDRVQSPRQCQIDRSS